MLLSRLNASLDGWKEAQAEVQLVLELEPSNPEAKEVLERLPKEVGKRAGR
jgi:hypothetical protein